MNLVIKDKLMSSINKGNQKQFNKKKEPIVDNQK